VQPRRKLRLAAKLPDPADELYERFLRGIACVLGISEHVLGNPLHTRGVAFAQRRERARVAVFHAADQDGIGKPLVDERSVGAKFTHDSAARAAGRLHRASLGRVQLEPDVVVPALRGSFGREYHYACETETTQRMLPPTAGHGAVALAERQTLGRGRLGRTWVDSGLMFSVALYPPPPVAHWPELTLVAAHAVAGAIGDGASIKHPNDVLVGGRKVAGILAEAGERVVLGIGINVGRAGFPGAGHIDRDRLELLADILERLERGYDAWLARTLRAP